jgi:hypothetical protein
MDMQVRGSSPTVQAKWTRGTPGRRFVSGNAPDNAERRHSDVSSSPPFISRRGAGPGA